MRLEDSQTHRSGGIPPRALADRAAFTILELMLAVSIMTVIVIGLYTVFDQTQKALRGTLAQVDVLEGIRATTDLMVRDLEGASTGYPRIVTETNFSVVTSPLSDSVELRGLKEGGHPLMQTVLQDLFLITHENDRWTALGYWVGPSSTNQFGQRVAAGRLYRYQYEAGAATFWSNRPFARFNGIERLQNSQPVMDGIVHLRLLAYDAAGVPLVSEDSPEFEGQWTERAYPNTRTLRPWRKDPLRPEQTAYWFGGTNQPPLPASVELEVGVLEPQLMTRYTSIPVATEARKFLARNAGQIHLFRQRIPLRNAPPP